MLTFSDDEFRQSIQEDAGIKPEWAAEAFGDLDEDVRPSIARIEASPFISAQGRQSAASSTRSRPGACVK
jgi:carbonic anhydrase